MKFLKLHEARKAKKQLDAKTFYGGVLHISYATEIESVVDVREKLLQRQKDVEFRLKSNQMNNKNNETNNGTTNNKRSLDDCVDQYISTKKRHKLK